MPEDQLVLPRRNFPQAIRACFIAESEARMVESSNHRIHPGVDIAVQAQDCGLRGQLPARSHSFDRHGEIENGLGIAVGANVV
jgi:hypothetical protein